MRDASGNPTGMLKDAAQDLVVKVIPPPSPDQIRTSILAAQTYANAHGVTSVQDMSAAPAVFRVYQSMLHDGELTSASPAISRFQSWQRLADVGIHGGFWQRNTSISAG